MAFLKPEFSFLDAWGAFLIVLSGIVGFIGGPWLVAGGLRLEQLGVDLQSPSHAPAVLWLLTIAVQGAVWAIGLIAMIGTAPAQFREPRPSVAQVVSRVIAPFAIVVIPLTAIHAGLKADSWPPDKIGPLPIPHLQQFAWFGVGLAALAVLGMLWTGARAASLAEQLDNAPQPIAEFLRLHRILDGYLLLASVVLGLGVVATAALRLAYGNPAPWCGAFHHDYVIAYGGLYSALLGITYAAARSGLLALGRCLRDKLSTAPPDQPADLVEWGKTQNSLDSFLRLKLGDLSALGETFSILAPLIFGAVSSLL